MWTVIPNSIKELHQLFKDADKSLFVVGGAVRDFLNKESPKDYDLATEATPEEVLRITKDFKNHLHGESFGVVVVYTDDNPEGFEVATFRTDTYRNGDIDDFILYINEIKPENYEERINLLLNLSKDE